MMSKQIQTDDESSDCGLLQLQLGLWPSSDHRPERIATATKSACSLVPTLTLSLSDDTKPSTPAAGGGGGGVSSPRSTVTSFSVANYYVPSRVIKREMIESAGCGEEAEVERASSRGPSAGDDDEDGGAARKKLRLTKEQSALLEDRFKEHSTLNPKQKQALAKQLNLRPRQVEVWFQNRRARTKLKQTEVDCDFLKRCCENLTGENRRLQKELQEIKAMKFAAVPSSAIYMQIPTGPTLSMCPSCERIATASVGQVPKGGGAPPIVAATKPKFFTPFTHPAAC